MSLFGNTVSFNKLTANYWTARTSDVGSGVLASVEGYRNVTVVVTAVITQPAKAVIGCYGVPLGGTSNDIVPISYLSDSFAPVTSLVIKYSGQYIFKTTCENLKSLAFDLACYGTVSITLDYVAENTDLTLSYAESLKGNRSGRLRKVFENDKIKVQAATRAKGWILQAVFRNIAVWSDATKLYISEAYVDGNVIPVTFDSTNFPNLIAGSVIAHILLVPWTRNFTTQQAGDSWRLVVITDKSQIYHNFPSRATNGDGSELTGDIIKFDESVVWDLPTRKFPSRTTEDAHHVLFPCLPDTAYEMHPAISTDNGYGNNGFPETITKTTSGGASKDFHRFYVWDRSANTHSSFSWMGGYDEPSNKVILFGTYFTNVGTNVARMCVFSSSDGGRQWHTIYEFGVKQTLAGFANNINTSAIATSYTSASFVINKRTSVIPALGAEEPSTKFSFGPDVVVSSITKGANTLITTETPHGLSESNLICFKDNSTSSNTSADFDWMKNDTASTTSQGRGVFFLVNVVNSTSFYIKESIANHDNPIPCRHIHSINRLKDGWMVGCGETYPEGWIMYVPMAKSDSFQLVLAQDDFTFHRLTSTVGAVQRPLGVIMRDDADQTIYVGVDNELTTTPSITLPNRTLSFTRNSCGVYKGKLSDIDDNLKYACIHESPEVAYYFKKHFEYLTYIGQQGHLALSNDWGETWFEMNIRSIDFVFDRFIGTSDRREVAIKGAAGLEKAVIITFK